MNRQKIEDVGQEIKTNQVTDFGGRASEGVNEPPIDHAPALDEKIVGSGDGLKQGWARLLQTQV